MRESLEKMGLTHGESQVYEALVENGPCATGILIRKANIASSKVYEVLNRLINKGLASFILKEGVKYFDATPPERLIDFIEEKRTELKVVQDEIKKIIPLMNEKRKDSKLNQSVIVYQGLRGPAIVLKECIEAAKDGAELLGFGTDEDPYFKYLPAQLKDHFREQKKYGIKWKMIFNKKFRSPNPLADIRFLPPDFEISVRTLIYGKKVAIVDFSPPITTIIIEKKEIVRNYINQFNYLWKQAKK